MHHDAASFSLDHGSGSWWDLWHYHADWPGWGNIAWRYRLEHIRALAQVFRGIARDADQFTTPFQTWIYLSGRDAGEDATYLHTPNENRTAFPVTLAGEFDWEDAKLLPLFTELLPSLPLRIGESRMFDEYAEPPRVNSSFFIYSPGIGVPLEQHSEDSIGGKAGKHGVAADKLVAPASPSLWRSQLNAGTLARLGERAPYGKGLVPKDNVDGSRCVGLRSQTGAGTRDRTAAVRVHSGPRLI